MLECAEVPLSVVVCAADAEILDRLRLPVDLTPCRVASDELMLLGPPDRAEEIATSLSSDVAASGGLILAQTSGWQAWTFAGDAWNEAFARLSALPLPAERPGFVQGEFAGVAAKVVVSAETAVILVRSVVADHVRDSIVTACRDLVTTPK